MTSSKEIFLPAYQVDAYEWNTQLAQEIYAVPYWGEDYFSINEAGQVCVSPSKTTKVPINLFEIVSELSQEGLSMPVLIRFIDILKDRAESLQAAFAEACVVNEYRGSYTPVYPIKVNQQKKVVQGILDSQADVGLEAGSKPELLAILALSKGNNVVVCNGYKDRAYIRLALIGLKMGLNLFIVIEKASELDLILEESNKLDVIPNLGVRIRLSSISQGKWQNSGGEKSKFGLNASEAIRLIDRLKQQSYLPSLQLMHFHMGSQVANIHDIKTALQEAARHYAELTKLVGNINYIDVGGGLGVDYEGSRSRRDCSMNYSMQEYAQNIVRYFKAVCDERGLPHPHIITESGRAMTAHHAVLVTDVIDVERMPQASVEPTSLSDHSVLEAYHDAQFNMTETRNMYLQGNIDLQQYADSERKFTVFCQDIKRHLNPANSSHHEVLQELNEKLADKIFCNFSLFQSMPDIWGIDQIFPIMPIQHLDICPDRAGVIQDLTCDSDGRIDRYINFQNLEKTLPIHDIDLSQPYYIGFFLIGAYQEILGDMHNLFGDTHSINVEIDSNGYHFQDPQQGEHVSDLLEYVHIDPEQLKQAYKIKLTQADLSDQQRLDYKKELEQGLTAYTYLEK